MSENSTNASIFDIFRKTKKHTENIGLETEKDLRFQKACVELAQVLAPQILTGRYDYISDREQTLSVWREGQIEHLEGTWSLNVVGQFNCGFDGEGIPVIKLMKFEIGAFEYDNVAQNFRNRLRFELEKKPYGWVSRELISHDQPFSIQDNKLFESEQIKNWTEKAKQWGEVKTIKAPNV